MIKKLDILILRAFIGPFFATFLISLFVLVMQFFWLYIDDLVGKGLEFLIIIKLIIYFSATAVPMALPLAMLLSSIMTLGNLGEHFELVAIKSAGISFIRFLKPLIIFSIFITAIAFVFSNNIIPVAQLKLASLKYDVIVTKPAFDIKEGTFYNQIQNFSIKIGKKENNDSTIRNIIIFERKYGLQDNMMIADSGVMRLSADKKFLEFILRDGWRYEEKGPHHTIQTDYIRLGFKEYKKIFDLSTFKVTQSVDSSLMYDPKMLSVRQLNTALDSLVKIPNYFLARCKNEINPLIVFTHYADTGWSSIKNATLIKTDSFSKIIPDSLKLFVYDRAISTINAAKNTATIINDDFTLKLKSLRYHEIEWHRKFTLSAACLVLFLIGAPLGSIIRKGGLGLPLLFSIAFFVLFHTLNTFGEKFAKEFITDSFWGMWLSILVMMPISIFLIYKAIGDSQLFNKEFYYRFLKKTRLFFTKFKQ